MARKGGDFIPVPDIIITLSYDGEGRLAELSARCKR